MIYIPKQYLVSAVQFDSSIPEKDFPDNIKKNTDNKYYLDYEENWTDEDTGIVRKHKIKREINHGDYVVFDGKRNVVVKKENFENMHEPLTGN